ncbi:Cytochrome P450 oxidoreductase [Penicillium angulare]|uniref:Cytochrome P450 oxidoreductase n=1 Tax=Penicillium angulare TaxID=116970 RepID=UPI0025420A30|nr:Cytochrome P450 oxidoreductase [Penicillium angulare]KAJ5280943.1 Cytochrome P450 oxidoreductase [Penicillium angulare]
MLSGGLLVYFLMPPRNPRQIPSVPFWVTLLPLFREVDQQELFRKYIAKPLYKHGAIKIFFGGQWNVIVQRSSYLSEVFKKEQIYNKSGNQKKIPHSLLAEFLGSNIISARADEWRLYRSVIQPGLQTVFETEPLFDNAQRLGEHLYQMQTIAPSHGVPIQGILQRYSNANLLHCVFDNPGLSDQLMDIEHEVPLHSTQLTLKQYLFRPIFMNFPVLDRLGSLIASRSKARALIHEFSTLLQTQILQDSSKGRSERPKSLRIQLVAARKDGVLTDKQLRDNLNVLYVAGQENPQLLMISALYLLAKYPSIQEKLRHEVDTYGPIDSTINWRCLPYLTATTLECLRLFPPISQLINRQVAEPTWLGGEIYLPPGTYIGYNSYATNRDPTVWGANADTPHPERWGSTDEQICANYRGAKARAEFISFHGGSRACLGEKFALLEIKVTLFVLVKNLKWGLDASWEDCMTPAGPLHPRGARLMFTKV